MTQINEVCNKFETLKTSLDGYKDDDYMKAIDHTILDPEKSENWQTIWIKAAQSDEIVKNHLFKRIAESSEKCLKLYLFSNVNSDYNPKIDYPVIQILTEGITTKGTGFNDLFRPYFEEFNVRSFYFLRVVLENTAIFQKWSLSFDELSFLIQLLPKFLNLEDEENKTNGLICHIMTKLRDLNPTQFDVSFQDYLEVLSIEAHENINEFKSFFILTNTIIEFFTRIPDVCKNVFLTSDFQDILIDVVTKNSSNLIVIKQVLKTLNTSCNEPEARQYISLKYVEPLIKCLNDKSLDTFAACVLVKMWDIKKLGEQNISLENLADIFITKIVNHKYSSIYEVSLAVEGLSYLTLKTSVIVKLRQDGDFCMSLLEIFKIKGPASSLTKYGIILILAHLSEPMVLDPSEDDDANLAELKKLRDLASASQNDKVQSPEEIREFINDYIVDLGFLQELLEQSSNLSQNTKKALSQLLFNICCNNEKQNKAFLQKVLPFGNFLLDTYKLDFQNYTSYEFKTLLKLTMNINPLKLFGDEQNTLLWTIFLLKALPTNNGLESRSKKTVLKVLVSLSNLASIGEAYNKICPTIMLGSYYDRIEVLLYSEDSSLQTAALQLVLNCVSCSAEILVKFFNFGNAESKKRFDMLVRFFHLNDIEAQKAVTAIVAIASGIPFIADSLAEQESLVNAIVLIMSSQPEESELMERVFAIVESCSSCENASKFVGNKKLQEALRKFGM